MLPSDTPKAMVVLTTAREATVVVLGRSDTLLFPFCFYFLLGGEPHPARRATETEALRKASLARPADCPAAV